MISHIRHSLTARITLWVVGFAAVIMTVILLLLGRLTHVDGSEGMDGSPLLTTALLTAGISLIVLLLLCRQVISRHLHPLDMLASSAQRIADGKTKPHPEPGLPPAPLPLGSAASLCEELEGGEELEASPSRGRFFAEQSGRAEREGADFASRKHCDEIGQLQHNFAKMQHALTGFITEMQQKRDMLSRQNEELEAAYAHAHEADSIKTQFLSRMTEQMGQTVEDIDRLTTLLCDHHADLSKTELMKLHIEMLSKTDTVTHLLDQMISPPTKMKNKK